MIRHSRRYGPWYAGATAVGLSMLVACGSEEPPGGIRELADAPVVAGLTRANSCDDLLQRIQADAIRKLEAQAEMLKEAAGTEETYVCGTPVRGGIGVAPGIGVPARAGSESSDPAQGPSSVGAPAPSAPSDGSGAAPPGGSANDSAGHSTQGEAGPEGPASYTDTNTQVAGVDEADIVKLVEAGETMYLLHGSDLHVLDVFPPEDLSDEASLALEGQPFEMFAETLEDGTSRAVVFSAVYNAGGFAASDDPAEPSIDCYGCASGRQLTKVTVIEAGEGALSVVRELYVEGHYVSSRMHGTRVRAVIQGGFKAPRLYMPELAYSDPWGRPYDQEEVAAQIDAWQARVSDDIASTTLDDWLPAQYEREGDTVQRLERACSQYLVPSPGLTNYGLTQVLALDMSAPEAPPAGTVVLGEASTVYANQGAMVLAHHDYRWCSGETERTALHLFELTEAETRYTASGFVDGRIKDQFSLDEKDGVVRVATTQRVRVSPDADPGSADFWQTRDENQVITVRAAGEDLEVAGRTEAFGLDETIRAVRYLGDTAYVVTFRQVDPFFVIDLSDPESPRILGELDEIPGFSTYMHPIDDDHLLTIGRNVDTSGVDRGLLLQIFDVSMPTDPQRIQVHAYEAYGSSAATGDHKAFTYYADQQLLAFPYVSYAERFSSTLELFEVDVAEGFTQLGSIDHTELYDGSCVYASGTSEYWGCAYMPDVRRGLFIDDHVYSISYGGVQAHPVDDLSTPTGSVGLPAPRFDEGYGYAPPGSAGIPVDRPAGGAEPAPMMGGSSAAGGTGGSGGEADAGVDTPMPDDAPAADAEADADAGA